MALFSSDLFKWPPKVGPSSSVIRDPKEWQDDSILIPHECFRWYHTQIRIMLPKLRMGEAWRIKLFKEWITVYYMDSVHHHHDTEENIYNPAITNKGGKLGPRIVSDHKKILDNIHKIQSYLEQLQSKPDIISECCSFIETFLDEVEDHLAEEEQAYPAALRSCGMTQAEDAQVVDQIIQSLGLSGNKVMLPPILYVMCMWKGEAQMQEFGKAIPPPIRLLSNQCWFSDFYHNNLCVIEALKGDNQFTPRSPECSLCSIM